LIIGVWLADTPPAFDQLPMINVEKRRSPGGH
jgi:hypothetical protein